MQMIKVLKERKQSDEKMQIKMIIYGELTLTHGNQYFF